MLFLKTPKVRRFDYKPRYSSPDRRERMKFRSKTYYERHGGKSLMYYLVLIIFFLLLYLYLRGGSFSIKPKAVKLTDEDALILENNGDAGH